MTYWRSTTKRKFYWNKNVLKKRLPQWCKVEGRHSCEWCHANITCQGRLQCRLSSTYSHAHTHTRKSLTIIALLFVLRLSKGFSVWEYIPESFHKDILRLIFHTLFPQKAKLKMCVSLPLVEGCERGEEELAFLFTGFNHRPHWHVQLHLHFKN